MAPIAVNTTEIEWSPAERFVSGSARQYAVATRPSVDVQSVPSFTAASNQANAGIPFIKENSQNQETENRCLTVWEVPVKEEEWAQPAAGDRSGTVCGSVIGPRKPSSMEDRLRCPTEFAGAVLNVSNGHL